MEGNGMITAMVVVKVRTEYGRVLLGNELREGTLLKGTYYPEAQGFEARFDGRNITLWVGDNVDLVTIGEEQEATYMMLDRLLLDCRYFLRIPNGSMLYYNSISEHMAQVRKLWNELDIKPEWLTTYKQIGRLEHRMNVRETTYDRQKNRTNNK